MVLSYQPILGSWVIPTDSIPHRFPQGFLKFFIHPRISPSRHLSALRQIRQSPRDVFQRRTGGAHDAEDLQLLLADMDMESSLKN